MNLKIREFTQPGASERSFATTKVQISGSPFIPPLLPDEVVAVPDDVGQQLLDALPNVLEKTTDTATWTYPTGQVDEAESRPPSTDGLSDTPNPQEDPDDDNQDDT